MIAILSLHSAHSDTRGTQLLHSAHRATWGSKLLHSAHRHTGLPGGQNYYILHTGLQGDKTITFYTQGYLGDKTIAFCSQGKRRQNSSAHGVSQSIKKNYFILHIGQGRRQHFKYPQTRVFRGQIHIIHREGRKKDKST